MKKWFALGGLVALVVVIIALKREDDRWEAEHRVSEAKPAAAVTPSPPPPPPAAVPAERGPVYVARGMAADDATPEKAKRAESAAMTALYAKCSSRYAWREGSKLSGEYNHYNGRTFVTIRVDLADPSKAGGDTLWYQVFFTGGKPAKFQATKTSAAELCGLTAHDQLFDL